MRNEHSRFRVSRIPLGLRVWPPQPRGRAGRGRGWQPRRSLARGGGAAPHHLPARRAAPRAPRVRPQGGLSTQSRPCPASGSVCNSRAPSLIALPVPRHGSPHHRPREAPQVEPRPGPALGPLPSTRLRPHLQIPPREGRGDLANLDSGKDQEGGLLSATCQSGALWEPL